MNHCVRTDKTLSHYETKPPDFVIEEVIQENRPRTRNMGGLTSTIKVNQKGTFKDKRKTENFLGFSNKDSASKTVYHPSSTAKKPKVSVNANLKHSYSSMSFATGSNLTTTSN